MIGARSTGRQDRPLVEATMPETLQLTLVRRATAAMSRFQGVRSAAKT